MSAPTVTPVRVEPAPGWPGYYNVTVRCPWCDREHTHGAERSDGSARYRAARCRRGGYRIEAAPEVSP